MEKRIGNIDQMKVWAKSFASELKANTLILLEGDLGSGKTFLVRQALESLGSKDCHSPTYSLHNTYGTKDFSVEHFDLYRLESVDDLESAGFFDIMSEEKNVIFVEWAERLPTNVLPLNKKIMRLSIRLDGEVRIIKSEVL